jgi:hypothetical protein
MAYSADWTLSQTNAFQNQVQMAAIKAAIAIVNEAATVHNTVDLKRHNLAVQVLNNNWANNSLLMQFVYAAIEASALVSGATDAQVDTAIATCWNGVAGVNPNELG